MTNEQIKKLTEEFLKSNTIKVIPQSQKKSDNSPTFKRR